MAEEKERSMDELLNLAYSEMTEEEIERVIEYRAEQKKNLEAYQNEMRAQEEARDKIIEEHRATMAKLESELASMQDSALDRLARASRGELI